MNTVPTSTTIHATITTRRWVTHQRATRRISSLLRRSPRVGDSGHEAMDANPCCRRPSGRTSLLLQVPIGPCCRRLEVGPANGRRLRLPVYEEPPARRVVPLAADYKS